MNTRQEFPLLSRFMGSNSHQNASERELQLDEIVDEEAQTWSAPVVDDLIADVQRALRHLDLDPPAFTLEHLGCDQDTSEHTTRCFFELIVGYAHGRKRAPSAFTDTSITWTTPAARISRSS